MVSHQNLPILGHCIALHPYTLSSFITISPVIPLCPIVARQVTWCLTPPPRQQHLKRTGWVRCEVSEPETVAGHMYRMSVMALVASGRAQVDQVRAVKMALVHDLAEALAGDITPHCGVSEGDKHAREMAALESMVQSLNEPSACEIMSLFVEYEANQTAEARFVHDLDKLDMILQADEYEAAQGRDLQQFFDSTRDVFRTREGLALSAELRRQRDERRRTGDGGATAETADTPRTNAD